ncbi:MAG TPA: hypothetical protein VIL96_00925 [Gaiellaceae bacterium]
MARGPLLPNWPGWRSSAPGGTAIKLGASTAYAAALVRTYWRHYAEELPAYRSAECRQGGKLDLGRADSIWP